MTALPGILAQVEAAAGRDVALRLAARAGGTEIYLSASPKGRLAQIVGPAAAKAIVEAIGRGEIVVPMAHLRGQKARAAAAAQMLDEGKSHNEVAIACDVHERTARRVRQKMKAGLGPLFDRD